MYYAREKRSSLLNKQYNKNFLLHLIVVPQLSGGWQHNYSTKTRQPGRANGQSMYSLKSGKTKRESITVSLTSCFTGLD